MKEKYGTRKFRAVWQSGGLRWCYYFLLRMIAGYIEVYFQRTINDTVTMKTMYKINKSAAQESEEPNIDEWL